MGDSSINGPFSMAMLNNQRVSQFWLTNLLKPLTRSLLPRPSPHGFLFAMTWGSLESSCLKPQAVAAGNRPGTSSPQDQWPFQEPKLRVPTIYKAYFSDLCKGISLENMPLSQDQIKIWVSTQKSSVDPGERSSCKIATFNRCQKPGKDLIQLGVFGVWSRGRTVVHVNHAVGGEILRNLLGEHSKVMRIVRRI